MADLVGVDLDATAVRAVEVRFDRRGPRVTGLAEVPVPDGAVHTGEILDVQAVAGALRQAWKAGRFRTRRAVLGLANQLAVVRPVELPRLSPGDLRAALRFELADLVPFPVAESVIDLHTLTDDADDTRSTVRLLAVVAHLPAVEMLLSAARAARLRVSGIDLVPFALVRAVGGTPVPPGTGGSEADGEAVVNVAGELISVVVHRHGEPRFARLVIDRSASSGAMTAEIEAALAMIETVRTRSAGGTTVGTATPPELLRDPVAEAIRSSLDYFAYQPTAIPVTRVRLTGTASRVHQLSGPLAALLGVPVVVVSPLEGRLTPRAAKLGVPELERFAAAFGLAVHPSADRPGPPRLMLLPPAVRRARQRRRTAVHAGAAATIAAAGLAAVTMAAGPDPGAARADLARRQAALAAVQADTEPLAGTLARLDALTALERRREAIVVGLVSWAKVVSEITDAAPETVTIVSLEVQPPATAGPAGPGRVIVTAQGPPDGIETWRAALATGTLVTGPSVAGDPSAGPVSVTLELTPAAVGSRIGEGP